MPHARSEYNDFMAIAPDAYEIVKALGQAAAKAGIDKQLLELIKLRASQINGCAFCVQFHILQGERLGIAADKLNLVVVWREVALFSARERAASAAAASQVSVFAAFLGVGMDSVLGQAMGQRRRRGDFRSDLAAASVDQALIGRDQGDVGIDPEPAVAGEHLHIKMKVAGGAVGMVQII